VVEGPAFLSAWESRQRGMAQPATASSAPAVVHGPRPHYVQAALDGELAAVRAAPEGTRNGQLNTSSLKLGRLVAAGLLDEDTAREQLTEAGLASGLQLRETVRTISSGMRRGLQEPRDPGAPQNTGASLQARPLPELGLAGAAAGEPVPTTPASPATVALGEYLRPAGTFLRTLPDKPEPVWGTGDTILWAQGEALMLAGGPGLGKTTLAGQLVRARLGLQVSVLDMPVREGGRLLYLAMDRPQQIARRLLQQFSADELDELDARMDLGVGPPPQDMARQPELLSVLCERAKADTVVVDSLKDAAIGLVDDEVGAGWNRARQLAVAAGVEVLELHHLVKRGANGKDPETLADVYGSAWLTAGAGSVVVLLGDAGSPIVRARHLKPVAEPFGPAELAHDHARGTTTVHHRVDLLELVAITRVQTARTAACQLFDTDKPKPAEVERARRKLEQLYAAGKVHRRKTVVAGKPETQYVPLTARSLQELQETPAPQPAAQFTPLEMEESH
jgi:hypothetical protein